MGTPDVMAQYNLFRKYGISAYENGNLKDYQTAYQLLEKIVPKFEEDMTDGEENKELFVGLFEQFSTFLFEYYLCLNKNQQSTSYIVDKLKSMSEKLIKLNENSFLGHFYLSVYYSCNLSTAHAGSGSAIHKGKSAEETIVGTAFSLLGKGLTLGVTATVAGISKSNFTNSIKRVIETYKLNLAQKPFDASAYFGMTSKMFDMAEFCESVNNPIWRDIYAAVKDFDVSTLDYSVFNEEIIDEAKEQAMEWIILADSKI